MERSSVNISHLCFRVLVTSVAIVLVCCILIPGSYNLYPGSIVNIRTDDPDPDDARTWLITCGLTREHATELDSLFYNTSIVEECDNSIQGGPFKPLANFQSPCWLQSVDGGHTKLRCGPGIYLLGFAKSGTSDLHYSLRQHPDIFKGDSKEYHYWNFRRLAFWDDPVEAEKFSQYIDNFDRAASSILQLGNGCETQSQCTTVDMERYYPGLVMDGSPSYMHMYAGWDRIPANMGLNEPRVTLAHTIHRLNPDTKFLVVLRDPVERAYSQFRHFVHNQSATVFHGVMVRSIALWERCLGVHTRRECAFNYSLVPCDSLYKCGVYLRASMYPVYLNEWLNVFDRGHFFFVKSEEYFERRAPVVRDILHFLNVSALSERQYDSMETRRVRNRRANKRQVTDEPMLGKTRDLLRAFYAPFVKELSDILNDERFKWDY